MPTGCPDHHEPYLTRAELESELAATRRKEAYIVSLIAEIDTGKDETFAHAMQHVLRKPSISDFAA